MSRLRRKFLRTQEHEFCPVCMLRQALAGGVESGESFSENEVNSTPKAVTQRLEHYELVMDKDGQPVELGRGAMGVTYKAFDVDLHCPVTLKVIGEKYLGDEAARVRFLREARSAASVRHPNVASVFHLGRRGQDYFYAMEFVELGRPRHGRGIAEVQSLVSGSELQNAGRRSADVGKRDDNDHEVVVGA